MDDHGPTRWDLAAFTAGLLSPKQEAEAREHIGRCAICAREHDSWLRLRGALGLAGTTSLDPRRIARIAALAGMRLEEVREERRGRALAAGLAVAVVTLTNGALVLLPGSLSSLSERLSLPPLSIVLVGLVGWWLVCGAFALGLLPLLRSAVGNDVQKGSVRKWNAS